ncbi:hypothetical protein VPH35_137248 [Triticum aestivum]
MQSSPRLLLLRKLRINTIARRRAMQQPASTSSRSLLQRLRGQRSTDDARWRRAPSRARSWPCPSFSWWSAASGRRRRRSGRGGCVPQLNRLLACRAYLVPGAADPSADCCSALSSISRDCACSTMGIINSIPSRCNIGQVNCSA